MWIEFIQLRKAKVDSELSVTLRKQVETMQETEGLKETLVLQHARYPSDLGIVLIWESNCQSDGSPHGTYLSEFLSDYGSVDHAVWRNEQPAVD